MCRRHLCLLSFLLFAFLFTYLPAAVLCACNAQLPYKSHKVLELSSSLKASFGENAQDDIVNRTLNLQYYTLSDLPQSYSISFVGNYVGAFVWNNLNLGVKSRQSFVELLKMTNVTPSIVVDSYSISYFNAFLQYNNISSVGLNVRVQYFVSDACFVNLWENYDIVVADIEYFSYLTRFNRDGSGMRKSGMIHTYDFIPILLTPFQLVGHNNSITYSSIHIKVPYFQSMIPGRCFTDRFYIPDLASMLMMTRFGELTQDDLSFIEFYNGWIPKQNTSIHDLFIRELEVMNEYNYSLSTIWSVDETVSHFLPSTCHQCDSSHCERLQFTEYDYWIIPNVIVVLIYFTVLFTLQIYKKPSIKRRLLVPYIPIWSLLQEVASLYVWRYFCERFFMYISLVIVCWMVLIYAFTVVRFYYLRNLYILISKMQGRSRIIKSMSSLSFGLLFTGVVSMVLGVLFSLHGLSIFVNNPFNEYGPLLANASYAAYILAGCIVGICAVIVDLIINRKNIKEKGLKKFLFFDDPFYVRVDLISLVFLLALMIILLILSQLAPEQQHLFFAIRFLMKVSIIFICSGTIICAELFKKFKSSKSLYKKSELERLFENTSFIVMFREYAEKELSLENVLIYQQLKRLSIGGMDKELSLEELKQIEKDFIRSGSSYELNIASSTRREFYELFERCNKKDVELVDEQRSSTTQKSSSQGTIRVADLFEILIDPLMLNLSDTFSRLIQTSVYEEWEQVYSIQQKNAAVD